MILAEAIKIDSRDAMVYCNPYYSRGISYAELGDHQKAIDDYSKAIEVDPQYAIAYCNRALSHAKLNNHQQAIDNLTEAIKIDPEYAVAYNDRGINHAILGNHQRAEEDLNAALKWAKTQGDDNLVQRILNAARELGVELELPPSE